jgi:co-chaperonin GroES (HSP10)
MLIPLNKYLTVELLEEAQTDSGVLIPEGVEINKQNFKVANIIEANAGSLLQSGTQVVIPSHMVEEVTFFGETYYLVLENHVIGYIKENAVPA